MQVWERMADLLFGLLDRYDDLTIFVLVFIEEAGVPLPLPSDLVMVVAGLRIAQGKMGLLWTLFLLEAATLLGASLLYWLAARGGRPLVHRYGRYVRLDHKTLDKVEVWVRDHGALAIVAGRLFPGLRIVTAVGAGVFGVPYRVFLPATAVGSFIYIMFWVSIGYFVGPEALSILHRPTLPVRVALSLVLFVALGVFLIVMYRRSARVRHLPREAQSEPRRLEASALAGFVATVEMGLGINALLYGLSAIGIREPERALVDLAQIGAARYFGGDVAQLTVALGALLFVGGIAWAILYAHVVEPLVPGAPWLRGLLFSALPLAVSVLVLLPALGGGFLGFELGADAVPLVGEILRNALFGVGLGTTYALLLLARQPPVRAHHSSDPADLAHDAVAARGSGDVLADGHLQNVPTEHEAGPAR